MDKRNFGESQNADGLNNELRHCKKTPLKRKSILTVRLSKYILILFHVFIFSGHKGLIIFSTIFINHKNSYN